MRRRGCALRLEPAMVTVHHPQPHLRGGRRAIRLISRPVRQTMANKRIRDSQHPPPQLRNLQKIGHEIPTACPIVRNHRARSCHGQCHRPGRAGSSLGRARLYVCIRRATPSLRYSQTDGMLAMHLDYCYSTLVQRGGWRRQMQRCQSPRHLDNILPRN